MGSFIGMVLAEVESYLILLSDSSSRLLKNNVIPFFSLIFMFIVTALYFFYLGLWEFNNVFHFNIITNICNLNIMKLVSSYTTSHTS